MQAPIVLAMHNSHPGHAALRRGRSSQAGQRYLITFTTHSRAGLFSDELVAAAAARAFIDQRLWTTSRLLAWVLMPDHWHGLIELGEAETLPRLVQRMKTNTARRVRQQAASIQRVWSEAYHDHALRDDEDTVEVARYIVANPVRAGLARRVGDYPYWDAVWLDARCIS